MTRQVFWPQRALDDLDKAIGYIAAEDAAAARRVAAAIDKTARALGVRAIGRPGRIGGTYEKSVSGMPYILAYALDDRQQRLIILRVVHSARDWRSGTWPP